MTPNRKKGARFGFALLAAASWLAPAAAAMHAQNGLAQPLPNDPLSNNLRILAESPHNVGAMIGAGKAALELGDAQGALAFFARAEQEAPRDGWVKKWEGSALVQLEQPAAALKYFRDAVSLGVPEASVAGDRGLAWDISGDPRRAQRDYRLALSQGSDPEVTRRLALSLAISGEREQALQLLQDQLQRRDRAADRTRAFVLALTGAWQDADRAVESALPAQQAAGLEPFLARLPSLSLADRALAVHLGHFPGTGRAAPPTTSYAQNSFAQNGAARSNYAQNSYQRPNYSGLPAGYRPTPQPTQNAASDAVDDDDASESRPGFSNAVTRVEPSPTAPRRIPGAQTPAQTPRQTAAAAAAPVVPSRRTQTYEPPVSAWSWSRGELPAMPRQPVKTASSQPAHRTPAPAAAAPAPRTEPPAPRPVEIADARTPVSPPVTLTAGPPPAPPQPAFAPPPVRRTAAAPQRTRLAEVAAELDRLDGERRAHSVAAAVQPEEAKPSARTLAATRAAARKAEERRVEERKAEQRKAEERRAEAREPARHWVQLAHGGSSNLGSVFDHLKDKAPKLLSGRAAWVAEGSPNRLVVGPFASERAAQTFADRLSDSDLNALTWTSDAGQKVEKLSDR
ncbi:MAG TPA: tetratricopeptide repeat protein [Allosphingosinicella sp.]|jgi:Flp pilus assembly protein TadD|nr:tetratricopeptide repeat protein [Allosphingosinicella sp.]